MALFSNSEYRTWYTMYDYEHNERRGGIYTGCRYQPLPTYVDYPLQWDFRGIQSIKEYTIDLSNTDLSNVVQITLLKLANGCSIKGNFYYKGTTSAQYGWICRMDLHWYDIDDNIILSQFDIFGFDFYVPTKYYDDLTAVKIWYSTPGYGYFYDRLVIGYLANYFYLFGNIFVLRNNASPYEPPILESGKNYNDDNLSTYYQNFQRYINDEDNYTIFLNALKNGGDGTTIIPIKPEDDISTPGGGDGEYNHFSDSIDFPGLPIGGGALASGFIRIYNPSSVQLNLLSSELWSDNFINEIKRIQNDPLEAIVSLHSIPFNLIVASTDRCRIGNYESNVNMGVVDAQYYTINCGNVSVPEHWGSALDYAPYTQVEVYLPFVGVKPLQIDDIMGKVLNVKYNIDILTGAAVCMIKCGDSVLYTYNTEVAQNIPFSASSHAQLYQSIISASGAVVGMMSGGAGAIVSGVQSAASVAASKHSQVSRGGSLGGTVGVLGDFVPYLIIHRPIQSLAADFAHKKGYPSNITANLSSLSGYTEVDTIHLEGVPCTDSERNELYNILKEGVIL